MRIPIHILCFAGTLALAAGCMDELDPQQQEDARQIVFTVEDTAPELTASLTTKATEVTFLSSVRVSATRGADGAETSYFDNVVFSKDGHWYKAGKAWPMIDNELHFYASNLPMVFDADGTYVDADTDTDAVVCYLGSPVIEAPNSLPMQHLFTRIRTVTVSSRDDCTISGVNVRIVPKTSGRYNLRTGEWTNVTTGISATLSGTTLGSHTNNLWLIPGPYFIMVSWTAEKDGQTKTFTDVSTRYILEAGKLNDIIFYLGSELSMDVRSYDISVDRTSLSFDYDGTASAGETGFAVSSSSTLAGAESPSAWRTVVKVDGNWVPLTDAVTDPSYAWLSSLPAGEGTPSTVTSTYPSPSVAAQQVTSHEDRLRSNRAYASDGTTPIDNSTSANAVDLSMYDFVQNRMDAARYTANCYVISSPGWYKFPLVYGNAIENGATNERAYKSTTIGTGHLDGFKNYKYNLTIADPWIENDWKAWLVSKNVVSTMAIQWQRYSHYDEGTSSVVTQDGSQGVIDGLTITSGDDGRYVLFHIDENNIRPGNILITARDAGGDTSDEEGESGALTMWSWHIWITDQTMTEVPLTNGTDNYTVLPVNTGWIDNTKGQWYAERTAVIRFESTEAPGVHSEEVTVTQRSHEAVSLTGWGPYYQWGRKDPFLQGLFTYRANYDTGIRGSVRHPEVFNSEVSTYFTSQYYDWATNNYDNMWDSQWNSYGVTSGALPNSKTVMDPSPRRFCVSPEKAWDGLVSYGRTASGENGYFYNSSSAGDTQIYLPATGYIRYDGTRIYGDNLYWGLHGWASLQRRASYGLKFNSSGTVSCFYDSNHRATGEAVRSVRYN